MKAKFVPLLLPFSAHEYDSQSALVRPFQIRNAGLQQSRSNFVQDLGIRAVAQ